ncbi:MULTISPECIES: DUF2087 domain-containing protein [unclassified Gemella]|uniref:DUF2087 domain-containing protein n=1 Tax=unclassified Gemella TaxID=2624949 RepID=UPI001C03D5C5|nr:MULTISPECIES: DUF2087 domain-containing protein [unclassified Gemella]MBU0279291.1 DUF2087 domain-containing protein [Gemella sp. zg-1178]QWQ39137.1 DUF2087 domain-containing protein [Gemella sp. zg-570]
MENEIINRYLRNGRLTVIPKKENVKIIIFSYLLGELQKENEMFSEKELNKFLKKYYDDYAILRRYMIDYGFLKRDNYGEKYTINKKVKGE